jgi:uncharacterized protein YlxW (UPF0749 family)
MLASIGRNIQNPIHVSLKKEGNVYLSASISHRVLSFPLHLLMQHLSRGSIGVPMSQAVVTRAWEAATTTEAAHVMMVLAAETSAHVSAEREARERVLRELAESVMALASAREEVEGLVRRISPLEGELAKAHQAKEMVEENSRGLFDATANAKR